MKLITRKDVEQLITERGEHNISIYIPAHVAGQAVSQNKDAIVFGNQLREIRQKLQQGGLNAREIAQRVKPLEKLRDDPVFWSHQSQGLAVFSSDSKLREFRLPIRFQAFNSVMDRYYLKPLMPLFSTAGVYYILALGLRDVKFYRATQFDLHEMEPRKDIPGRLEDIVGYDYEQKSLQFKTQKAGEASFHGHGAGKDERKDEILNFFRAINDGLMSELHGQQAPLVVACLDYLFPLYEEANDYSHLLTDHLSGNPADLSEQELLEAAWRIVQPEYARESERKTALFHESHGTGSTSTNIKQVLPAAEGGRVDALFLEKETEIWGTYQEDDKRVEIHDKSNNGDIPLTDLAAAYAFLQGGQVYLLDKDDMPDENSPVNALYRY